MQHRFALVTFIVAGAALACSSAFAQGTAPSASGSNASKGGTAPSAMSPATPSPPAPGSTGISGDWHNEIHLNHSGCFKIARAWSEHIEAVLEGRHLVQPAPTGRRGRGSAPR
jgi:hypothetical protein